ncbi:MAG: ATP-binding protein [Candidatus Eremiobacteraeota bacterium]|nr:ATP-binding protein [Candidatus Eremiobacteraeota bacterium]
MAKPEAVLDLTVPPHPQLSRAVRKGVGEFALAHGVGEDDLTHFLTAIGEALANAIEHARAEEAIEIEVRVGVDRIVGTVHDKGVGFRFESVPEANTADISTERGRGLPIMRRCSDIFSLYSVPGEGTAVVLGRFLRPKNPPQTNVA